jgi:ribosomal protein S18 acetylase RimI-like enzyme
VLLAERDGSVAGVVNGGSPTLWGLPEVELLSLYVAVPERGHGLADLLIDAALRSEPAHLSVFEKNERAIAFYAKHGLTPNGERWFDQPTKAWEIRLVRSSVCSPERSERPS